MTLFLTCQNLSKAFGSQVLFENLSFSIKEGDRIGLIGRNGSGKSTLLKILAGQEGVDKGTIAERKGLKIGYLPQTCDFPDRSIADILKMHLDAALPDYEKDVIVNTWLSKLGFRGDEPHAAYLSGGWKKRLWLAAELMKGPHLLLLDEPTNHLDIEGILWLEKFLEKEAPSYLLVSHDRFFLQNRVNRVIEIDTLYPEGLFSLEGSYAHFLEKKEEFIQGQLQRERAVASKARKELAWLRESPKARTTKAEARVEGAHEVLAELSALKARNRTEKAGIDFVATERETRKLLVCKNIGKSLGEKQLFAHVDLLLSPGSRIGLMGPNGSGKTTFLRILAGEITQDMGTIKTADDLKIVYFDQHRTQLPDAMTLRDALSPSGDYVTYHGQKIHVNGWCKRFLFAPDFLDMPLGKLSGGERARIAIAHLMLQPADLLLLDEPTNDLDIPTLETLEESLLDFSGAIVLITHDRAMLSRVCNDFITFGAGESVTPPEKKKESVKERAPAKLSYQEKKEYDQIEGLIMKQEEEIKRLNSLLSTNAPEALKDVCTAIGLAELEIERLYLRFDELSRKQGSA